MPMQVSHNIDADRFQVFTLQKACRCSSGKVTSCFQLAPEFVRSVCSWLDALSVASSAAQGNLFGWNLLCVWLWVP